MKYLAVFDDIMIRSLRRDEDGLTIVLYDKDGNTRTTRLLPIQRPVLTMENGGTLFLTQDHIQALKEYEKKKMYEELTNHIIANIEEIKELDGVFPSIKKLEPDGEMNGMKGAKG